MRCPYAGDIGLGEALLLSLKQTPQMSNYSLASSLGCNSSLLCKIPPGHYVTQSRLGVECYRKKIKSKAMPLDRVPKRHSLAPGPCVPARPPSPASCVSRPPPGFQFPLVPCCFPPHDFICSTCFPGYLVAGCLQYKATCPAHLRPGSNAASCHGDCAHAVPSTWNAVLFFPSSLPSPG